MNETGGENEKKRSRRNEDKTRRLIYASRQDGSLLPGVIFILHSAGMPISDIPLYLLIFYW